MQAGAALLAGRSLLRAAGAAPATGYTPVITPNGSTMPYTVDNGVKVFHLVAEPVKREFTAGIVVNAWGYNGQTPGPTIECVEGDRVRIYVTNHLPEPTSVHWHGMILPNGMDGITGLTQKGIEPGETYVYEFTLRQHGTLMYHPHTDEMTQIAMGMAGFFIIHPRHPEVKVDRDFAIFLGEWRIPPDTATPNPMEMTDFNYFTFNSRVYPGTDPLIVKQNQRVRVRLGNLTMDEHPIHLHGHTFWMTGTSGGRIPKSAQVPGNTVAVPLGDSRDIEFVADNPGDWPFHCHKTHHTMNGMVHDLPNMMGVPQKNTKAEKLLPEIMPMGDKGMEEMTDMQAGMKAGNTSMSFPPNTVAMGSAPGPFGNIAMGGMFTIVKVREKLDGYKDPGWYCAPAGTLARKVAGPKSIASSYTCVMHPEIHSPKPGKCPKCGMTLVPEKR